MKKFMILYLSSVSAREQMAHATPEQMQAGMAEWLKWIDDAVKLLKDHPHFKTPGRASIEVLEFVPMPGT